MTDKLRPFAIPIGLFTFCVGIIMTLVSVIHAGDMKKVGEIQTRVNVVQEKVNTNCNKIAVLESNLETMQDDINELKQQAKEQHNSSERLIRLTEAILRKLPEP